MVNKKLTINNLQLTISSIVFLFILTIGYFISRIINLTTIPVFCDEAIYIRWAQVMRAEPSLRFLPLSDGKQPLFMWLMIPFLKVIKDPLAAGRMVSVFSGFGTMVGVFALSYLLFKKIRLSFLASILYLISPFSLFFDRMALVDGLLSFLGIWFLIFSVWLVNGVRLDLAMIGGIILGLGLITKSPALFFAILLPTTLITFNFKRKDLPLHLIKVVGLWLVVWVFGFAIYNILRLGPEFHMISIRNKDYVFSFSEVLKHPLTPFLGNSRKTFDWFWVWLTPPIFVLGIFGIYLSLKKNFNKGALLLTWFLLPLIGQGAIAKVYTARYILFSVPLFLIFAAFIMERIFSLFKNKVIGVIGLVLVLLLPCYQIFLLISNPAEAWLPVQERKGYLEEWTAGYGIKEAALYLKKVAQNQKVLVGTEGFFGTLPDGLQIYLEKIPNITVVGVGYPIKEIPDKLTNALQDNKVFLLVNDSRFEVKETQNLKFISKYPKAENPKTGIRENLLFFEILK